MYGSRCLVWDMFWTSQIERESEEIAPKRERELEHAVPGRGRERENRVIDRGEAVFLVRLSRICLSVTVLNVTEIDFQI